MKALKIAAKPREEKGSGPAGRMRRDGFIPGVVYGDGKEGAMVQVNTHDFEKVLRGHSGEHMMVDLVIEGSGEHKVLIKEVQHHPVSRKILHVDFNEVSLTKRLHVQFPITLVGDAVGVTQQGGVLEHLLREVEVECLPTDMIEAVEVDVTNMGVGDSLTVKDINLDPDKYVILTDPDVAITAVAAPRVEEEPVVEEGAVLEAGAGPEVITEKKEEGEEGAGEEAKSGAKAEG